MWPNSGNLQDIRLQNPSDLNFDLSRSLKIKRDSAFEDPIYGFILIFNTNHIWLNYRLLEKILGFRI